MLKRHTFEKWLVLSALLFLSMGCALQPPSTSTGATAAPAAGILIVERSAPISPGQCYLTVALNQPPHSIDAHVILTAERGIRFMKTGSETSEQITMTLKAGEIREHTFHCRLEEADIHLPGEYVVQAVVLDRISGTSYM